VCLEAHVPKMQQQEMQEDLSRDLKVYIVFREVDGFIRYTHIDGSRAVYD
jgi:hypothetical protein